MTVLVLLHFLLPSTAPPAPVCGWQALKVPGQHLRCLLLMPCQFMLLGKPGGSVFVQVEVAQQVGTQGGQGRVIADGRTALKPLPQPLRQRGLGQHRNSGQVQGGAVGA